MKQAHPLPRHVLGALGGAISDSRRLLGPPQILGVAIFIAALFVPSVGEASSLGPWIATLYLAAAAIGLDIALGIGGLASLGQGAFVGIGAFSAALLLRHTPVDPVSAALAGAGAAALAGLIVGYGAVHLKAAFVVVVTWVFSWALYLSLSAFPSISGGAQGIVVERDRVAIETLGRELRFDTAAHFRIAVILVAFCMLLHHRLRTTSMGLEARAMRIDASAADALGTDRASLQLKLFVTSAAVGGLAGGWAVQLAGVADPSAYGPTLSVTLFVIALLGSGFASWVLGAALLLGAVPFGLRASFGGAGLSERFEPAVVAVAMVVALVASRSALFQNLRARFSHDPEVTPPTGDPVRLLPASDARSLAGRGLSKRFGGVVALDAVDIDLVPGEIHALIGPNGSGKTTLLRVLSGTSAPDGGRVLVDGEDITMLPVPGRVRRGVVRTLQRSSVFVGVTVEQNLTVAMHTRRARPYIAEMIATPSARAERWSIHREAESLVGASGLAIDPPAPAEQLSVFEQRSLSILAVEATGARFFLLDEPAAGVTPRELPALSERLRRLRESGVSILLVDHNMRLVRSVADRVTVMAAGSVVAGGSFDDVLQNNDVKRVYPGLAGI